jgi:RNA polymerase sigma factor (sigma-70 family)
VSPSSLRRYRAERLLRREFETARAEVIASTRGRLRACGVHLDASDLEACYAEAWHGLYAAVLDGQEIANLGGWLTLVTYRRAIEEHRRRSHEAARGARSGTALAEERDFAAELDDRTRLRQLFEGLRGRLSAREREAAALCYLQGLSRSEAAARMGVSETRMRKLMEGRGASSPGVAGKVGMLVETIRTGGWCEEQGSLMRGFAFGILDPQGERYRLAMLHHGECPACRSYVLSLRGLAAILPPVPALLQLVPGLAAGGGQGAAAAAGAGSGVQASGAAPAGSGAGALTASGAAGAGAAGGGWLLAGGPLGAKLAVGCMLALGVGAGCIALSEYPGHERPPASGRERSHTHDARASRAGVYASAGLQGLGATAPATGRLDTAGASRAASPASSASREFGPEQHAAPTPRRSLGSTTEVAQTARVASAAPEPASETRPAAGASGGSGATGATGQPAAQREFAPG